MDTNSSALSAISLFFLVYAFYILRETSEKKFDLYDLVMLSAVGFIPLAFVLFPQAALVFSNFLGVAYPFVVMYGLLFIFMFIFIHKLTGKIHQLERDNRLLMQEVSILKFKNKTLNE
jgi:hypothetical protein